MFDPGTGNCKAKKGLLVLRECGQTAIAACGVCGIPLCQQHQIIISHTGAVLCPECAAKNEQMAPVGHVGWARRRSRYYHHYHYYPYYWMGTHHTHHRYFNGRDESTLDKAGVAAGATAEPGAGAAAGATAEPGDADELDSYDATES